MDPSMEEAAAGGSEAGVAARIALVTCAALAISAYLHRFLLHLPQGLPRLAAALPVLLAYALLPLALPRRTLMIGTGLTAWFFAWLGSSKLLLLCWGGGPGHEPWVRASFLRFAATMHLPLQLRRLPTQQRGAARGPKKQQQQSASPSGWRRLVSEGQGAGALAARCTLKLLALAPLLRVFQYTQGLPAGVTPLAYSVTLYLFCGAVLDALAAAAAGLLGLRLDPHFASPFLARSLEDFWARRWNLVVSALLRETVYEPVRRALDQDRAAGRGSSSRSSGSSGRLWAPKLVALVATFAASGALHELVLWYMTGTWTGELLAFFTLQGVATAVQVACKPLVPPGWVPGWVGVPLTLGFVIVTAVWLFFPPFVATGADVVGIRQMRTILGLAHL